MARTDATSSLNRYAPQTAHLPACLRMMQRHWSQTLKRGALAMIWSAFVRRAAQKTATWSWVIRLEERERNCNSRLIRHNSCRNGFCIRNCLVDILLDLKPRCSLLRGFGLADDPQLHHAG